MKVKKKLHSEDKGRPNIEGRRVLLISNQLISSRGRLVMSMLNKFPHSLIFFSLNNPQMSTRRKSTKNKKTVSDS